jgi:hypothetical protein
MIIVEIVGEFNGATAQRTVINVASYMQATKVRKILFDARYQAAPLSIVDGYEAAIQVAERLSGARVAVVIPVPVRERPFIEVVAVNHGANMRYFDDYDQALAWLGVAADRGSEGLQASG